MLTSRIIVSVPMSMPMSIPMSVPMSLPTSVPMSVSMSVPMSLPMSMPMSMSMPMPASRNKQAAPERLLQTRSTCSKSLMVSVGVSKFKTNRHDICRSWGEDQWHSS